MAFTLPPLPYAPEVLEPYIDKMTMEIHHGRHHKAYVDNLNKALEGDAALQGKSIDQRTELRGNVTVRSRPALLAAWRVEPNLAAEVTVPDASLSVLGVRLNVAHRPHPVGVHAQAVQPGFRQPLPRHRLDRVAPDLGDSSDLSHFRNLPRSGACRGARSRSGEARRGHPGAGRLRSSPPRISR